MPTFRCDYELRPPRGVEHAGRWSGPAPRLTIDPVVAQRFIERLVVVEAGRFGARHNKSRSATPWIHPLRILGNRVLRWQGLHDDRHQSRWDPHFLADCTHVHLELQTLHRRAGIDPTHASEG